MACGVQVAVRTTCISPFSVHSVFWGLKYIIKLGGKGLGLMGYPAIQEIKTYTEEVSATTALERNEHRTQKVKLSRS